MIGVLGICVQQMMELRRGGKRGGTQPETKHHHHGEPPEPTLTLWSYSIGHLLL
jgi:hypothetical protein